MFLAYMDDSGTGDKAKPFQLMTAVIIPDLFFQSAEILSFSSLAAKIPSEKAEVFWENFEEFKAWQLYGGHGPFDGIEQSIRFSIIEFMLRMVKDFSLPVVYGALEKAKFRKLVYGSASPLDVCFRICMKGVEKLVAQSRPDTFALLIVDESNKERKAIRDSFYEYRERLPAMTDLPRFHDDMYFGDSRFSIGIQLADLCGYFVAKHLEKSVDGEAFYELIKDLCVYFGSRSRIAARTSYIRVDSGSPPSGVSPEIKAKLSTASMINSKVSFCAD